MNSSHRLLKVDIAVCHRIENCHAGSEQIDTYAPSFDLADQYVKLSRLEVLDQLWPFFSVFTRKSFCGRVISDEFIPQGMGLSEVSTEDNDGPLVMLATNKTLELA